MTTTPRSFAALRQPKFRGFLLGNMLAMMADNIEHVISYWIVYEQFRSPALGGFAVIAHWVPYLLLSVHVGALCDRIDPRRIIQAGMALFMAVSIAWGILIYSGILQPWHAAILLILHGIAGVLWVTPSQVIVHDLVGVELLPSAVRLSATGRYLGMVAGPAVGAGLLMAFGPSLGIIVNALIYIPMLWWLHRSFRESPHAHAAHHATGTPPRAIRGIGDILDTARGIAGNHPIVSMMLLAGGASLIIGNAYQAQMPGFARDLGHDHADLSYSMLLGADAAGALIAGFVLESRGLLQPRVRTAFILAMLWCCALGSFAVMSASSLSIAYAAALVLLFAAGFLELSFNSMAQTLVQLNAPPASRGRVIGLYAMVALGLRAFAGVTVGLGGSLVGIHWSLALSALALLLISTILLISQGGMQHR